MLVLLNKIEINFEFSFKDRKVGVIFVLTRDNNETDDIFHYFISKRNCLV